MGKWRRGSKQTTRNTNPQQGRLHDASWQDYLPEDVGKLVLKSLSICRGVLLSVAPSGEILVMRLYHNNSYTPIYGRSLGELTGRIEHLFGSGKKGVRHAQTSPSEPDLAPMLDGADYLIKTLGWPPEAAQRFQNELDQRNAWLATKTVAGRE